MVLSLFLAWVDVALSSSFFSPIGLFSDTCAFDGAFGFEVEGGCYVKSPGIGKPIYYIMK